MAGQRCKVTDIRELLRRLRAGDSDRRIARELTLSRNTVAKYRHWAREQGLLEGVLPEAAQLATVLEANASPPPPQTQSRNGGRPIVILLFLRAWLREPRPRGRARRGAMRRVRVRVARPRA